MLRHYTADTAVIGPVGATLNQRAQGCQNPLDDLGWKGTPLPLFERELFSIGLVQLEHPLHLGGEASRVDLEVYLVVAEEAVAVYVRRADRGPDAVYGCGLGVDHDVPVAEDPDTSPQKLVEVAPAEPVRRDEAGPHRPVGDEVGMGEVDVLVGPVYGLEVHGPDREDPHVRVVAVEHGGRVPRALPARPQLRQVRRAVGVPEVHEVVFDLAGAQAPDPNVGVAPARRVEGADVVAAEEGNPPVHCHQVAVVPEDVARIREVLRTPQRPEVERVYFLGEPLERGRDDDVRKAVEDHAHHHPPASLPRERLHEAAPHLVTLPDERADEDLLLGALNLLEHRLVEQDTIGVELEPALARLKLYLRLVPPREPLARPLPALTQLGHRRQDADQKDLHRRESREGPEAKPPQVREREHADDYIKGSD